MKQQWQKLSARFGALKPRERVLVLLAAVVGTALVIDTLALQPLETRKSASPSSSWKRARTSRSRTP